MFHRTSIAKLLVLQLPFLSMISVILTYLLLWDGFPIICRESTKISHETSPTINNEMNDKKTSNIETPLCPICPKSPISISANSDQSLISFADEDEEGKEYALKNVRSGEDNIFFVETSCVLNRKKTISEDEEGGLVLNTRQACSVYSAALIHPDRPVYIYYTCPLDKNYYDKSSEGVQNLLDLENIHVVPLSSFPGDWFKNTPLEGMETKINQSDFVIEHASDCLRMLLLWKYGGTYLDLDVLVLRDLRGLGVDWAGAESNKFIASGIFHVNTSGLGHMIVQSILEEIPVRYNPQIWSVIGPFLATDIISKICEIPPKANYITLGRMECGFTVHGPEILYPLIPQKYKELFQSWAWKGVINSLGKAFTLHAWNRMSSKIKTEEGSAYSRLGEKVCPGVHKATGGLLF